MTKSAQLKERNSKEIQRLQSIQLVIILTCTLLCFFAFGKPATQAYIIGSMIAWFGACIYRYYTFKYSSPRDSQKIVMSMYKGQMIKWFVTIILFVIIFKQYKTINALFLFLGFSFSQLNSWIFILKK